MYSVVQLCLTFFSPIDCSPPSFSVHGILQARISKWFAVSYYRGFSQPRDQTCISCVSCIGRQILYYCATWEATILTILFKKGPQIWKQNNTLETNYDFSCKLYLLMFISYFSSFSLKQIPISQWTHVALWCWLKNILCWWKWKCI